MLLWHEMCYLTFHKLFETTDINDVAHEKLKAICEAEDADSLAKQKLYREKTKEAALYSGRIAPAK
jgi:hypothetical protein